MLKNGISKPGNVEESSCRRHETLLAPGNAWGLMVDIIISYKLDALRRRRNASNSLIIPYRFLNPRRCLGLLGWCASGTHWTTPPNY